MKQRITPQQIVFALAQSENLTKKRAENFVRSFFELVEAGLREDKLVKIKNFGTFKVTEVSERESVNIQTGERFQIDSHSKITFTPDTLLKEKVNKPFSQFQTVVLADDVDEDVLAEADEKLEAEIGAEEAPDQMFDNSLEIIERQTDEKAEVEDEKPAEIPAADTPVASVNALADLPEAPAVPSDAPADSQPEKADLPAEETAPNEAENLTSGAESNEAEKIENASEEDTAESAEENLTSDEPSDSEPETHEPIDQDNQEIELDEEDMTTHKSNHRLGIAIGLLLGALLLCGAYLAGYYNILHLNLPPITQKAVVAAQKDSVAAQTDSVEAKDAPVADVYDNHVNYEQIPDADFLIVGELEPYVLKKGDGLYMLAKRVYGDKEFARYIIFYNKLKNPDNVPVGTELKMPELRRKRS